MQIFVPRTKDIGTWYAYVHEGEEHAETAMRNRVGVDGPCSPRKALAAVNRKGIHRGERKHDWKYIPGRMIGKLVAVNLAADR